MTTFIDYLILMGYSRFCTSSKRVFRYKNPLSSFLSDTDFVY